MKRYEGLFILNLAGKEEGLNEAVDKLKDEINAAGGRVESIQKMEKKPFVRVTDKKITGGHYVNVVFDAKAGAVTVLNAKFKQVEEVYRVLFSEVATPAK